MRADVFTRGQDETCLDNAMGRSLAEGTNPPLGAGDGWGVQFKLARGGEVCCSGFEGSNVGSMPEFGLKVRPEYSGFSSRSGSIYATSG